MRVQLASIEEHVCGQALSPGAAATHLGSVTTAASDQRFAEAASLSGKPQTKDLGLLPAQMPVASSRALGLSAQQAHSSVPTTDAASCTRPVVP